MKVRYAFKHTAAAPGAMFYTFKHTLHRLYRLCCGNFLKVSEICTDKTDETYYTGGSLLSSCLC